MKLFQLNVAFKSQLIRHTVALIIIQLYFIHFTKNVGAFRKDFNQTLIVLPRGTNRTVIRENFQQFQKLFNITPNKMVVNFENGKDFTSLMSYLEKPRYSTIVYVLNRQDTYQDDDTNNSSWKVERQIDTGMDTGSCDLIPAQYSSMYNKTVLFWPCPNMKKTQRYLPSYETVSFAVKSVSKQFEWKEAILFASEPDWGLPLAIAANLHVPYRIKLGIDNLHSLHVKDHDKKVIIVCSPLNSMDTSRIISRYKNLKFAKILLIDIIGSVFNTNIEIYKKFANYSEYHNILVLTILNEKLKQLLNATEFIQYFNHPPQFTSSDNIPSAPEPKSSAASDINHDRLIANKIENDKLPVKYQSNDGQNVVMNRTALMQINENLCNLTSFFANFTKVKNFKSEHDCINSLLVHCKNSSNVWKLCNRIVEDIKMSSNESFISHLSVNPIINRIIFSEYFNLFNYVVNIVVANDDDLPPSGNQSFQFDFVILDFKNIVNQVNDSSRIVWRPFLILQQNQLNRNQFTMHTIIPEYFDEFMVKSNEVFWSCGIFCWSIIAIGVAVLFLIIFGSILVGIAVRNYLLKKRLSKGPNKIVLSASDFVFPVDSRRVDEGIEAMLCCWLQQLQEFGGPEVEKPDLLKGSIGSLKNLGLPAPNKNNSGSGSLARHNTLVDLRARYNGDIVQLKEITATGTIELKAKAMDHLLMIHGLRNENINPLIGWLSDPQRSAMVFEYCSRGSLQDVLIMDEIKLDWSFRLSLLTDIVRGMRYLHSSSVRVHGALSSRNCVVDARWVLKITDYALPAFYDAQGLPAPEKTSKQMLWSAPEALRGNKNYPKCGTQAGDVYSFGIIMQEVVVRGEPYCMLSLSPEEIITKIKKPPPLIRPSVSKGAAPPEAINIMRQCWAENPEMRPDFATVCERFKQLNHGRKVNFVDTMFQMLEKYSNNLEELIRERTEQLEIERKKTEQLLNRMLPSSVAEKLKMGRAVDPEEFSDVTIYFSDIVGFTTIAAHCSAVQVVDLLNDLYTCFDATINAYNVYKVETIGDAYMVVSGLPVAIPDHAEQIATMALDLLHQSGIFRVRHMPGVPLQLRIGLHTGHCCAGVVGLTMPRYCLFGDTVNTGSSWRIHMSEVTKDRLEKAGGYIIESRGPIDIKGKGIMNTYWLLGKEGFNKILPQPPPIGESHGIELDSIIMKADGNRLSVCNTSSSNPSSSHSPSVSGEQFDVKVEITPPQPIVSVESPNTVIPKSFSNESTSTLSVSTSDYQSKTTASSPQQRKFSEIHEYAGLLGAMSVNMGRLNTQAGANTPASSRFFKRIEEMIDLSSPYNHYKCLSPSETNLSQFADSRTHAFTQRTDKPGSGRLLRRQFSLDKDDAAALQQSYKQHQLEKIQQETSLEQGKSIPKSQSTSRMHKQHSISTAQDLEKIEENPISPKNHENNTKEKSDGNIVSTELKLNVDSLTFR